MKQYYCSWCHAKSEFGEPLQHLIQRCPGASSFERAVEEHGKVGDECKTTKDLQPKKE